MATTKETIGRWFDNGVRGRSDFMIVVCDTFDGSDAPNYCMASEFWSYYAEIERGSMNRIMEIYNLHLDRDKQLAEERAYHPPIRVRKLKHEKVTRLGNLRCDADQQRWPCQFELARLLAECHEIMMRLGLNDQAALDEVQGAVAEVAKHDWE